jgi:hypothetical protein
MARILALRNRKKCDKGIGLSILRGVTRAMAMQSLKN